MHCISRTRRSVRLKDGFGTDGGGGERSADWGGSGRCRERERGAKVSNTPPWWRRGMGAGCVRACMDWRVVGQSRRYLFYPHGRCRWCSQQRRDLGGIAFSFESGRSIYGPAPWDYCCCFLFEVAVRVWCRVAAGSEVVVEVFLEASELGVCSLAMKFWWCLAHLQICPLHIPRKALTMLRSSTTPSLTHTLCAPIMFAIIMSVNRRSPTIATCSGLVT